MMIDVHHQVASRTVRDQARTIRRHYLAKLAAKKAAAQKAAAQAAKQQAAAALCSRGRQAHREPEPRAQFLGQHGCRSFPAWGLHPQRRRGRQLRLGAR